ncbi:unnamed protein product, partial [Polarella glacialis]
VHALLSSIESREAGLRLKVQQLTEEKALREQKMEDEISALRRSNARLEDQLRTRHAWHQPELYVEEPPAQRGFGDQEAPSLGAAHDLRHELQQQLQEIRAEVTRCARALQEPQALPSAEVLDIRQQLAALSSEVLQTSRALSVDVPRGGRVDTELEEVKRKLESLQGHVSKTMSAAMARPVSQEVFEQPEVCEDTRQPVHSATSAATVARDAELAELRAEVNQLRAQMAAPPPLISAAPASASPQPELRGELRAQIEAIRHDLGQIAAPPAAMAPMQQSSYAPEVAALHGRLTAIRAEVARVLQESQNSE